MAIIDKFSSRIPTETAIWKVQGLDLVGIDVADTFTSGSIVAYGSNDGHTMTPLVMRDSTGAEVAGAAITATGHYELDVAGFAMVYFDASAFSGDVVITGLGMGEE